MPKNSNDIKRRNKVIALLFLITLIGSSGLFLLNSGIVSAPVSNSSALLTDQSQAATNFDPKQLNSDFPDVQKFEVANAKGTIVYVPQIHKDPATQPSDQSNDQAVKAQKEIYQDLATLSTKYGVKYVMDETDVYGPMPQAKIDKINAGFNDIAEYNKEADKLAADYVSAGGSQQVADQFKKEANDSAGKYERNIYITGGAAVLAAKDVTSHAYGSQVPETLDKSKKSLENLLYLQERINQLQGINQTSIITPASTKNPAPSELSQIKNLADQKKDKALTDDVNALKEKQNNLSLSKSFEAVPKFSEVPHNNNPYAGRTDLANLKAKYQKDSEAYMSLIKDQRSAEVSDNVVRMMQENGQSVAGLVFGAGHKDQIVQALNSKGYSVIVITTPAVKAANAQ